MTAEQLLERGINLAGNGMTNPLQVFAELARLTCGDTHFVPLPAIHICAHAAEHRRILFTAQAVAGGSLTTWSQTHQTPEDTVELLEDTLFKLQVGT